MAFDDVDGSLPDSLSDPRRVGNRLRRLGPVGRFDASPCRM